MSNQDQGREYARAERPKDRQAPAPAEPPSPAERAPASPREASPRESSPREDGDRAATNRAQRVVVRARRRSGASPRPGAPGAPRSPDARGPFAGRGPKGYRRDDRRIREDICDLLLGDSEVDASEITVTVAAGEVTFDGTVSDRATKHYVECIGAACLGVTGVQNNLRTPGMGRAGTAKEDGAAAPDDPLRLEFDRSSWEGKA